LHVAGAVRHHLVKELDPETFLAFMISVEAPWFLWPIPQSERRPAIQSYHFTISLAPFSPAINLICVQATCITRMAQP